MEWTKSGQKRQGKTKRSRSQDGNGSPDERLDQLRSVRRKVEEDGLKVVVNFKEGHDIKKVSPVALSRGL